MPKLWREEICRHVTRGNEPNASSYPQCREVANGDGEAIFEYKLSAAGMKSKRILSIEASRNMRKQHHHHQADFRRAYMRTRSGTGARLVKAKSAYLKRI